MSAIAKVTSFYTYDPNTTFKHLLDKINKSVNPNIPHEIVIICNSPSLFIEGTTINELPKHLTIKHKDNNQQVYVFMKDTKDDKLNPEMRRVLPKKLTIDGDLILDCIIKDGKLPDHCSVTGFLNLEHTRVRGPSKNNIQNLKNIKAGTLVISELEIREVDNVTVTDKLFIDGTYDINDQLNNIELGLGCEIVTEFDEPSENVVVVSNDQPHYDMKAETTLDRPRLC